MAYTPTLPVIHYECLPEIYRNLEQLYEEDPRFTAYYNKFCPGLAIFARDAIVYYCDQKMKFV